MVTAQLAQLDDTFFEGFVQLENSPGGCLILGYTRDSGPSREYFPRRTSRMQTAGDCLYFWAKNIFCFRSANGASMPVDTSNSCAHRRDSTAVPFPQFLPRPEWMACQEFCCRQASPALLLQHHNS